MLPLDASADDVLNLAAELKTAWGTQREIDDLMLDLYRQKHIVPVTTSSDPKDSPQGDTNQDIQPIGMGKAPQIVDQWAALLGGRLRPHVAQMGNSPTSEARAMKLEEFGEGALQRMEQRVGSQFKGVRKDIALFGRGVIPVFPAPQFWSPKADKAFRKKSNETKGEWLERINDLKRQRFPIYWEKWDARSTYFRFGEFSYDTVRIRTLNAGEIIRRFPDAKELQGRLDKKDLTYNSNVEVIYYVNDEWYGMFAGNDELRRWEHNMGINPVVLFEGNPMPDNDEIRWYGILYHARHLIPAYDELVSNILTNARRDTRALTVVYHDKEIEGEAPEVSGRPKKKPLRPGGQLDAWTAERPAIERVGAASSSIDYQTLIPEISSGLGDFLKEIFMGQVRSDTTGTAIRLIAELANILQGDVIEGIRTGGKGVFVRVFHAVKALEEEVKQIKGDKPDKVYVRVEDKEAKSREIAVSAEDVQGYDDLVSVRYGLQTATDQRALGDYLRLMTEDRPGTGPMIDMTTARELGGFENPLDIEERVWRQRVSNSPEFISKIVSVASERFEAARETGRDQITPEQMALLQQILAPEQLEFLLGGNGAVPQQGASSNVPLVNAMGAGEQIATQEPRV